MPVYTVKQIEQLDCTVRSYAKQSLVRNVDVVCILNELSEELRSGVLTLNKT